MTDGIEMTDETNRPGRPTKYRPEMAEQAEKLCRLGATDAEIADFFEVAESTVNNWKDAHPEFSEALKKGKALADAEVADKLYRRALGYSHDEEKLFLSEGQVIRAATVKHYPPDTTACIFWLKNRQSGRWRNKVSNDHNFGIALTHEQALEELKREPPDMSAAKAMLLRGIQVEFVDAPAGPLASDRREPIEPDADVGG
jgi:hypothetical protein